jgi:two-component system, LytTR family, response regulator
MQPTYKCLIAEDNLLDRDAIAMYLSKIDNLSIEAVCSNGLEAAAVLQQKEIDIVLSDIDMPGLSGIELIQTLKQPPVFIFISAYPEYAAESYNLDVIDFIVKPVSLARLVKAANKAIEYIELKKNIASNNTTASGDTQPPVVAPANTTDHFFIKENSDYTRIDIPGLLYIESMGNFSKLHTQQKKYVVLVGLKNIEPQLPAGDFMRIHKQYIINIQHMVALSSEGEVQLSSGHHVPVGDMYKAALMEIVNKKVLVR